MIVEQEGGCGKGRTLLFCSLIFMPTPHAEILHLFRLVRLKELQVGYTACIFIFFLLQTRISYYFTVNGIPGFCKKYQPLFFFFLVILL